MKKKPNVLSKDAVERYRDFINKPFKERQLLNWIAYERQRAKTVECISRHKMELGVIDSANYRKRVDDAERRRDNRIAAFTNELEQIQSTRE